MNTATTYFYTLSLHDVFRSAEQLDLPLASAADYPELPLMEERLSSKFLRDAQAVPLREDDEELALAIADPTDSFVLNAVQMRSEEHTSELQSLTNLVCRLLL